MIHDLPDDGRDDEIVDDGTQQASRPQESEASSPTSDAQLGNDDPAAENTAETDADLTLDDSGADLVGDEREAAPTTLPADAEFAENAPLTDVSEEPSEIPKAATKTDWSNFVPAPGYADPETGKPIFRVGNVDQAGLDLMMLVHGLRPLFEPEPVEAGADRQPPPFLSSSSGGNAGPAFEPPGQHDAGPSPLVSVDVRVTFTPAGLEQVSNGSLRKAAQYSRDELLVVATKLDELCGEIRARERQRRILARQY